MTGGVWTTNKECHKINPNDKKRRPKEKEKEHLSEMDVKWDKKSDLI